MNKKLIITLASFGLLGTALALGAKRRADAKREGGIDETPTDENKDNGSGGTTPPTPAYSDKVKTLQGLLYADGEQCGVDGDAGKQTNGMLDYWFCDILCEYDKEKAYSNGYPNLKKLGKGKVSPANVDYYIGTMRLGASPRQRLLKYLENQQRAKELTKTLTGFKI